MPVDSIGDVLSWNSAPGDVVAERPLGYANHNGEPFPGDFFPFEIRFNWIHRGSIHHVYNVVKKNTLCIGIFVLMRKCLVKQSEKR